MEPARPHRPLTVAELVTLHSGPPGEPGRAQVAGTPLSVGALLRREGRAPHAFDRPTVPRGHSRPPEEPPAPPVHSGRRATVATGAVLMVGAVLGTAVVNESVVAQPHLTPGSGTGTPAAEAAAVADPTRSADAAVRPVSVSYFAPLTTAALTTAALTTAVPAGFDFPVASGASIGRGALGGSPAGAPSGSTPITVAPSAPAPGAGAPQVVVIPQPRPPVENQPPPAAAPPTVQTPVVVVPSVPLPPVLGPAHTPAVTVSPAQVTVPTVALSPSKGVQVGRADVVTPDVVVGDVQAGPVGLSATKVGLPDVAVSKASVGADVALPAVSVSPTTLTTPDLKLGKVDVPLPDVSLPAVAVPSVKVPVSQPVKAVTGVVGGLLGQKG